MNSNLEKPTIYNQLLELLKGKEGKLVHTVDVRQALQKRHGTNLGSLILSDFCYNRFNSGIAFQNHLFEYVTRSTYKYLGENYPYSGFIFHKKKGAVDEEVVGEWRNGVKFMYHSETPVSQEQLERMYEEYIRIFRFELAVLKCAPAELRHLLGRIGELHCAMNTKGSLAKETNQHGFDVIAENGRCISVKTTTQKNGFIPFNSNTFNRFDDVYVLQYINDDFKIIYYGEKERVREIARLYEKTFEVDISKLKKLVR
ncbi:hypothetical protein QR721_12275 [Aciduricibacillus chroicocephali]|uniref:Protein NO VEIN C-terminal domain-containing protein n=1 Tax=Aciduricibacillus chroicocephali TaxID=3054939 RepID=A0ABY9KUE2_9BACI|nr:hypothetical protein QR721_12275 [Bacillaceae bacterium 44XB]